MNNKNKSYYVISLKWISNCLTQPTLDGLDKFAEMQEASEKTAGEKADAEKVKRNGDKEQMDNCDAGKSEVRLF